MPERAAAAAALAEWRAALARLEELEPGSAQWRDAAEVEERAKAAYQEAFEEARRSHPGWTGDGSLPGETPT